MKIDICLNLVIASVSSNNINVVNKIILKPRKRALTRVQNPHEESHPDSNYQSLHEPLEHSGLARQ